MWDGTEMIRSTTDGAGWRGLLGFGIFLVVVSIPFGVGGLSARREAASARSWEMRPCTVIASNVSRAADGHAMGVNVTYRWEDHGRPYEGHRYAFFESASNPDEEWPRVVGSLVPGSTISCFVDPEHPERAVIDRAGTGASVVLIAISLVLAAFGVWCLLAALARRRRRRAG